MIPFDPFTGRRYPTPITIGALALDLATGALACFVGALLAYL